MINKDTDICTQRTSPSPQGPRPKAGLPTLRPSCERTVELLEHPPGPSLQPSPCCFLRSLSSGLLSLPIPEPKDSALREVAATSNSEWAEKGQTQANKSVTIKSQLERPVSPPFTRDPRNQRRCFPLPFPPLLHALQPGLSVRIPSPPTSHLPSPTGLRTKEPGNCPSPDPQPGPWNRLGKAQIAETQPCP